MEEKYTISLRFGNDTRIGVAFVDSTVAAGCH